MAIELGSQVQGTVTNITNFGAFVDLGDNQTGLVHISEIANHFVKDINDELSRGDVVNVKVLKIEDNGNIALSIKQADQPENADKEAGDKKEEEERKTAPRERQSSYSKPKRPSSSSPFDKKDKKSGQGFDDLMSDFLKSSEERLTSLKRNTEHKRGGRGGRRG